MRHLDLLLTTAGRPLMLTRDAARALILRGAPPQHSLRGSFVRRALQTVGAVVGMADDDDVVVERPAALAFAPYLPWAPDAERCDQGYTLHGAIAVIDVKGVLTPQGHFDWWDWCWASGYEDIGVSLRSARADMRVKAILLRVDSPGGLCEGCLELAEEIREGSARRGGKPIWAATATVCSSAYALASACDRIVTQASCYTGCIGVYMLHVDESGMLKELGIKITPIESSPHKTDFHSFKPLDDGARADAQAVVDETDRMLFACVTAGRPALTADRLAALEGRSFMAQHSDAKRSGLALGLIDAIGTDRIAAAELATLVASAPASPQPDPQASKPAANSAAPAGGSTETETDMSLKTQIAALMAGTTASADDKLKQIQEILDAKEDAGEEDEPNPANDTAAAAAPPAVAAAAQNDGFAVLDLPEAKGRDELAKQLARKVSAGKMSLDDAKSLLAAAPKQSRLADAMASRDQNPGTGTVNERPETTAKVWDGIVADVNKANGAAHGHR